MNNVIDPVTGNLYDVETWLKKCENRRDGICPVCNENVTLRADKSENRTTHFFHGIGSKCPTKHENHIPFTSLPPGEVDRENSKLIRGQIIENSFAIYEKCKSMADRLTVKEFRELIESAHNNNIWDYKGLTFTYIPYILLTCRKTFKKKDSSYREDDFYFVFDPNIKTADELWINPSIKKQKIWKVYIRSGKIEEYGIKDNLYPSWFDFTKNYISKKLNY